MYFAKVQQLIIYFSEVQGMATVGHMMSQITKNRAVITDPVSKVIYTQFKQVLNFNVQLNSLEAK